MSHIDDLIRKHCPNGIQFEPISSIAEIRRGSTITKNETNEGDVPVIAGGQKPAYFHDQSNRTGESVVVAGSGAYAGFVTYWDKPVFVSDAFTVAVDPSRILPKFCFHFLKSKQEDLHALKSGGGVPHVYGKDVGKIEIPMPPLQVQREIVRVLDAFQELEAELEAGLEAELEARRKQYTHFRRELLTYDTGRSDVAFLKLAEVANFTNAKAHERVVDPEGDIALLTARFISTQGRQARHVKRADVQTPAKSNQTALVMSDLPNGRALARAFFVNQDGKYAANQRVCLVDPKDETKVSPRFLYYILDRNQQLLKYDSGFDQTHLSKDQILGIRIPVPAMKEQLRIVAILDELDSLVNDLSVDLPAELVARRRQYETYRDRLLSFEAFA